jgi:hypothetical protein
MNKAQKTFKKIWQISNNMAMSEEKEELRDKTMERIYKMNEQIEKLYPLNWH